MVVDIHYTKSISTSGGSGAKLLAFGSDVGRVIGLKTNELGEG